MEQFSQFMVNNWQYISIAFVVLLEIVLMLLKRKKPVAMTDGQYQMLIEWIVEAEKYLGSGQGELKKQFVIDKFRERYPQSLCDDWVIGSTINEILACPTRKGGLGREQVKQKKK